jgi:hypothetical protein
MTPSHGNGAVSRRRMLQQPSNAAPNFPALFLLFGPQIFAFVMGPLGYRLRFNTMFACQLLHLGVASWLNPRFCSRVAKQSPAQLEEWRMATLRMLGYPSDAISDIDFCIATWAGLQLLLGFFMPVIILFAMEVVTRKQFLMSVEGGQAAGHFEVRAIQLLVQVWPLYVICPVAISVIINYPMVAARISSAFL